MQAVIDSFGQGSSQSKRDKQRVAAERLFSASADNGEDCQDIMFVQFCVKLAVFGIDHAYADFITINSKLVYDISWSNFWLILSHFRDKAAVAEVGKQFNGYFHLEIPERINFLRGEVHHGIMRRQRFAVEKFRQPVICIGEPGSLVERPLCLQD